MFEEFDALSFDCYGTLIDWEAGIAEVLRPWARANGSRLSDEELLRAYADEEARVAREQPVMLYPSVLAGAFRATGTKLGITVSDDDAARLGASVPDWPAFPDSADALRRLAKRFKLIILSNVDRQGFAGSNRRLGVDFDHIITAQDVGSYKPAARNFEALTEYAHLRGFRLLHVAQSLFHDHVPASQIGLSSVWINRRHDRPGWGATPEPAEDIRPKREFHSMSEFAETAVPGESLQGKK